MNECRVCSFYFRRNFKTKSKFKYIVFCRNPKNINNYEGNANRKVCPKLNDVPSVQIDDEIGKLIG